MRTIMTITVVLAIAAAANADSPIWAEVTGVTSSDPAYRTYTVTLHSTDPNTYIHGWGGSFTGTAINQQNPFDMSTIWQDNNVLFPSETPPMSVDLDSQFLYLSAEVVTVASANSESATNLTADFSFPGGGSNPLAGLDVPLAQVCLPAGMTAVGEGDVLYRDVADISYSVHIVIPVPEPATLALLALGGAAVLRRRRQNGQFVDRICRR